jgi:hypothetical protein
MRILKLKLSHYMTWRCLERKYSSYSFSTSALEGGEWSASRPCSALAPGNGPPGTHCTRGWVGPRTGLDTDVRGPMHVHTHVFFFIRMWLQYTLCKHLSNHFMKTIIQIDFPMKIIKNSGSDSHEIKTGIEPCSH